MGNNLEETKQNIKILQQQNFKNQSQTINLKPTTHFDVSHNKTNFHYVLPLILENQSIACQQLLEDQYSNESKYSTKLRLSNAGTRAKSISQSKKITVFWNSFVKIKNKNFLDDYEVVKPLGKGGFGMVSKIRMKNQQKIQRAAKIIKANKMASHQNIQKLCAEVEIPMRLDHPNIVKLYEVFQWKQQIVLIQQICQGGDLLNRVRKMNNVTQKKAAEIMTQVLSAVVYMHKLGIVHRDIKPQNILYNQTSNLFKIADFGTAAALKPNQKLTRLTGSPYYIAPQVLKTEYDQKCDVWSCGIMLYVLLAGFPPFYGQSKQQVFTKIKNQQLHLKGMIWENRSKDVKELLLRMLDKDPKKRITALQALNSFWIKNAPISTEAQKSIGKQVLSNLRSFSFKNRLQAVVYTYVASQLYQSQQKSRLLKAFQQIDTDQDGVIQRDELMLVFQGSDIRDKISEEQLQQILNMIDFNGSGLIDFTQFLVAASKQESLLDIKRLESAFDYFDTDRSGYISVEEVKQFLDNKDQQNDQIKKIFDQVDQNGDGMISKDQFMQLLLAKNKPS